MNQPHIPQKTTDPAGESHGQNPAETATMVSPEQVLGMAHAMTRAFPLLLSPAEFDGVMSGHGDTGAITMQSDLSISDSLLAEARRNFPHSFSEENDPIDAAGRALRTQSRALWVIDPVDGSGDRKKFAGDDRSAARGFTSLAAFVVDNVPKVGLCSRPAYGELWRFDEQGIAAFRVSPDLTALAERPFNRVPRERSNTGVVYVNLRPAYPETNFPAEFFELARECSGNKFHFVNVETGGAGDAFAQLVEGNLDIVLSGRKTDWKVWDTAPFAVALDHLRGDLTDFDGGLLSHRGIAGADTWHKRGVLASLGSPDAHWALLEAFRRFDGQAPLFFDPRT